MKKKKGGWLIALLWSILLCVSPCAGILLTNGIDSSVVSAMTNDPYKFYWDSNLGNKGYGVVQEDANIYWCSRGNVAQQSNVYRYDNVGWYVQIRSEKGQEVVIYIDDTASIYGAEKKVDGYFYTIQRLSSQAIFDAIYESKYDYKEFCGGTITVEFDGNIRLYKAGATTYGPYDLRSDNSLNLLLKQMGELSFTETSKTAIKEQFRNKVTKISGETVLEKHTYHLNLQGKIDGNVREDIAGYGTVDVYVDNQLMEKSVTDYSASLVEGSFYSIKNIDTAAGYHNVGKTSFEGKITGDVTTCVELASNVAWVSYDPNGGTMTKSNGKDVQQLKYGRQIITMTEADLGLTKEGYTITNWKTKAGTLYKLGSSYDAVNFVDEDGLTVKERHGGRVYMYAQWSVNKYKIEYDANGGTGTKIKDQDVEYDKEVQLTKNTYEQEGFTFIGWNTKKDGTGKSYKDEEKVKKLASEDGDTVTLYAMWDEAPKIEAYDIYVTANEVEIGKITEAYLMEFATAVDKEDGTLYKGVNHIIGKEKETSFSIVDYQESDFEGISNGSVSITYHAIDSVGNVADKLTNVYIVDDALQIPVTEEAKLRFISEKHSDTLSEDSIWNTQEEYKDLLDTTLLNMQYKVDSEIKVETQWGDETKDPGSGVFLYEPMKSWILNSDEIQLMQDQLINSGFSYAN